MKMRLVVAGLGLVAAAMAAGWVGAQGLSKDNKSAFGLKGLTEVRELVVTYERGEDVTVKAHLVSGVTVEDTVKHPDEIQRLFQISHAFAGPRARLAVTLEKDEIVSYHLATGVGPGGR
jgi:hypothetical protein